MKSNILKTITFTLLLATMFSCTDLKESPYSSITTKSFFKSEDDAIAAVNGIYEGLHLYSFPSIPALRVTMYPGMYSLTRNPNLKLISQYKFDYTQSDLNDYWRVTYDVINRCNMAIKYIPAILIDETKKNAYIAEAKWIRAYCYFNLVRLFGDVQLRANPTELEADAFLPRTSAAEIYSKLIIPDLQFAEQYLPLIGINGRIGRGAAPFLLGKVYLTMAGLPLKDVAKLTPAKEKIKQVIDNKAQYGYALMSRYIDVFPLSDDRTQFVAGKELNKELIFVYQQMQAIDGHGSSMAFSYGPVNSYWSNNGAGGQHQIGFMEELYNLYDATDERRNVNLVYEYILRGSTSTKCVWGVYANYKDKTWGMCQNKYIDPDQLCCNGDPDIIIYRLADAYLMLAEIENEINGPNTVVYDNLDVILSRAKATLVNRTAAWTKETMRNLIFKERVKELNFEYHDIFDLRRLGKVKEAIEFNSGAKAVGTVYDPKYELYPIPRIEKEINPNCTQNSGW